MAEYKAIHGFTVQNRTSDPLASGVPGATWASGGTMNTGRTELASSKNGTQSATITFGGFPPAPNRRALTELYNGTGWTEVGDLNTGRSSMAGTGTATAALATGGGIAPGPPNNTNINESWNGASWTEVGDLNTTRRELDGCGVTTAALAIGGAVGPPLLAVVENFNGASWTEVGDLNTARANLGASGTSTAAIAFGGNGPNSQVELWNGSSWTETTEINTARTGKGNAGPVNTDVLLFGGNNDPGALANTEYWDGSSWAEVADLPSAKTGLAGSGSFTAALAFGGSPALATTEEWNAAGPTDSIINTGQIFYRSDTGDMKVTLNVLGTGAWSSGGNLNQARSQGGNNASGGSASIGLVSGEQIFTWSILR